MTQGTEIKIFEDRKIRTTWDKISEEWYLSVKDENATASEKGGMEIVCYCSNVSKETILEAIKNGAKNLQDIRDMTSACTIGKCKEFNPKKRCCSPYINKILEKNVVKSNY